MFAQTSRTATERTLTPPVYGLFRLLDADWEDLHGEGDAENRKAALRYLLAHDPEYVAGFS